MSDFDLNTEIAHIMGRTEDLPECCRTIVLKFTAAWVADLEKLRTERDTAISAARCIAAGVHAIDDADTRLQVWTAAKAHAKNNGAADA